MIIDKAKIYVKAGNGGEGLTSKMMFSPRRVVGGGGNGGKGGDVVLQVSPHLYDLNKFREKNKFIAENGGKGGRNNQKGKTGREVLVNVPRGTIVADLQGEVITDLCQPQQSFVICKGGAGGEGNYKKFYSLPPSAGEEKEIFLDYRIYADAAVMGFANSGKTTLVNKFTGQNFKTAEYPFTTEHCRWAKGEHNYKGFIVMDTPPLRRQASKRGYESDFLKHLFRPKVLLFLSESPDTCRDEFRELEEEIRVFDEGLMEEKKVFYLLTKVDKMKDMPSLKGIMPVSAQSGYGVEELKKKIISIL